MIGLGLSSCQADGSRRSQHFRDHFFLRIGKLPISGVPGRRSLVLI
jgi:hypothetical protein